MNHSVEDVVVHAARIDTVCRDHETQTAAHGFVLNTLTLKSSEMAGAVVQKVQANIAIQEYLQTHP